MLPILSYNGRLSDANTPLISAFDRGFTLGDGVFETMQVTDGTVWYVERHLARLADGAARLGLVVPPTLRAWIGEVVQRAYDAGHLRHVLRITLTRGVTFTHGLGESIEPRPTVVIAASEWPHVPPAFYERGISVHIASPRRYEGGATVGVKTTSYLESVLALREAVAAGYEDALVLDTRGCVAEGSSSNVFVWRGPVLMTPPRSCGILPGITREVVLEIAAKSGVPVAEQEFTQAELYSADEIFLTSSLRGIVPVRQVDQQPIGSGGAGKRTVELMRQYEVLTERV